MKNRFFFLLSVVVVFSCNRNDDESANESAKLHPAYLNPIIKPFTDLILDDSTNAKLYFERAAQLDRIEVDSLTMLDLKKAIQLAPENKEYRESYVWFLINRGLGEEALKETKVLQTKFPQDSSYLLMEAEALMAANKLNEADNIISQLLVSKPNSVVVLLDASKLKAAQKDTASAIDFAKKLATLAPNYYDGVYQLADLYRETKNKEAIVWYDKIFKLDTLNANPIYDISKFYYAAGDIKSTKQYLIKSVNIDKNFVKAYLDYGHILLQEDSVDKADRQFQLATEIAPANAEAYYGKGLVFLKRNNKDLAERFFEQAIVFDGRHQKAWTEYNKLVKK